MLHRIFAETMTIQKKEHVYTSVEHPMDLRLKSDDRVQRKFGTRSF